MADRALAAVIALVYIAVIVRSVQRSGRGPALLNRNIWLVYLAYIAILWNLWFFSFWSVQIVKEAAQSSLLVAALTAAFNAGAGILGFPAGGWLADRAVRTGRSRKTLALVCTGRLLGARADLRLERLRAATSRRSPCSGCCCSPPGCSSTPCSRSSRA